MIIRKLSVECPITNSTNYSLFTLMMFKRGGSREHTCRPAREDLEMGFFLLLLSSTSVDLPISSPLAPFPAWFPTTTILSLYSLAEESGPCCTQRDALHTRQYCRKRKTRKPLVISKKLEHLSNSSSNLTVNLSTWNRRTWFKVSPVLHR